MVLIIGGHVRSGTTLLRNLCNRHPDVTVTMEFGNFSGLGKSYTAYSRQILQKWWRDKKRSYVSNGTPKQQWKLASESCRFVLRYLFEVKRQQTRQVEVPAVEAALRSIFPTSHIVGDKSAYYVFHLDKMANIGGLIPVIIYRDCRDVTSSTLEAVRTKWRGRPFVQSCNTVEKIAKRWLHAIELMELHAEKLHIIRYENLVQAPKQELEALARCLNVTPGGFSEKMLRCDSIGKYKTGLTKQELTAVMGIVGRTMARLGYV